jgi:hypothetical protein
LSCVLVSAISCHGLTASQARKVAIQAPQFD